MRAGVCTLGYLIKPNFAKVVLEIAKKEARRGFGVVVDVEYAVRLHISLVCIQLYAGMQSQANMFVWLFMALAYVANHDYQLCNAAAEVASIHLCHSTWQINPFGGFTTTCASRQSSKTLA